MIKNLFFLILLSWSILYANSNLAQNCAVNAGVSQSFCPGDPMTLFGNVTGLYNGTTINWAQISGPATTIANPNSLTSPAGNAVSGATYVFQISATCQDNNVATNTVTYTVATAPPTPPTANAGTSPLNAGCLAWGGSIPLNAVAAPPGFQGRWSIVSGGRGSFSNANSPTSTFTPIQDNVGNPNWYCPNTTNSYVLRWTLSSTSPPPVQCPTSIPTTFANLTVNVSMYNPVDALAIPPGCGNASTNTYLYGTCPGGGTISWSLISGPAGYTFAGASTQNVTLSNLPTGTYTFRYSVTGTCTTGTKDVTFSVQPGTSFAVTAANANAGNIVKGFCGEIPTSKQLSANLPNAGETGTWSQVGGGTTLTFSNINDPNAIITGMTAAGSPYKLRWTISNASGCSSIDSITLVFVAPITPPAPLTMTMPCNAPVLLSNLGGALGTYYSIGLNSNYNVSLSSPLWSLYSGWYISGFNMISVPPGSAVPLGPSQYLSVFPYGDGGYNSTAGSLNSYIGGLALRQQSVLGDNVSYYFWGARPITPGAYTGVLYAKNENCGQTISIPFTVNLSHNPSDANAGTDQNLGCNVTQTNLAGSDPNVTTPYFGKGTWEQIAGPNTAIIANVNDRSTLISSLIPGTYQFVWKIWAGDYCPAKHDTVLVRVSNAPPSPVSAGTNQTVCFGSPLTLTADLSPTGNLAQMLSNTGSRGVWRQISGPSTVTFSDSNAISTVVNGLVASGTYVFRYLAINLCGTTQSDVTITTSADQGPSQANAGANQCLNAGVTTFNLSATLPTNGTGTWTKLNVANPGTITNPSSNTTTVTGVTPNGVYGFIWTVSTPNGCASTIDTVYISNTGPLTAPNAGADQNICANTGINTFTLTANTPTNGTGVWSQVSGPSGAIFNPNTATTIVTTTQNGQYIFRWTNSNGACTPLTDDVIVNLYNKPEAAVSITQDTTLCGTNNTMTLRANSITNGVGVWSVLTNAPATIASPNNPYTSVTVRPGTTAFRWFVSLPNASNVCPATYDQVNVKYIPNANAKSDTAMCKATAAILRSGPTGGATGAWSVVSQPGGSPAVTFTQQGNDSTYSASPLVTGTYTFRWTVTDPTSVCVTTTDDKVVTIDDLSYPNAGTDGCGVTGTPITLSGSAAPVGGTAQWSIFSRPSSAVGSIANSLSPNTTYNTPNVPGAYNFTYTHTKGACTLRDYVSTQVGLLPVANASTTIYCDPSMPAGLDLLGNNPTPYIGSWSVVTQPPTSVLSWTNQNSQNANVKNLTMGTYVFRYTITNDPCPANYADITINSICFALPIPMSNLAIREAQGGEVELYWSTEQEQLLERFVLEYSEDGRNFTDVKPIAPKGDGSKYSTLHKPKVKRPYYRLRIVEKSGEIGYSNHVSIELGSKANAINYYPNPTTNLLTISAMPEGVKHIMVLDNKGALVQTREVTESVVSLNFSELAAGSYLVVVKKDGVAIAFQQVIKQ